jgi:thiol-disulfide isomerase/thioredoxin
VRLPLGVILAALVALAGCNLPRRQATPASSGGSTPFLPPRPPGADSGGEPGPADTPPGPPATADGVLAGHVLDASGRPAPNAIIQVVDLTQTSDSASVDVAADRRGTFKVVGLEPHRKYQIIARITRDGRVYRHVTTVEPPNARMVLVLREAPPGSSAPRLRTRGPEKKDAPKAETGKGDPPGGPAAAILPPRRPGESAAPSAGNAGAVPPAVSTGPRSDLTADRGQDGYLIPQPPAASMNSVPGRDPVTPPAAAPSQPHYAPPAPPTSTPEEAPVRPPAPPAAPAPAGPSAELPDRPAPIPSCRLAGNRLDNFALYTSDGDRWEFRKHRKGRLLLVDFWATNCGPCLNAIPHLVDLQEKYGSYGLQIVGVACETGRRDDQVARVRQVRSRYRINYTVLMAGGGTGPCPVKTQFDVRLLPTAVLIDETGKVIWRSGEDGLDDRARYELAHAIYRALHMRAR